MPQVQDRANLAQRNNAALCPFYRRAYDGAYTTIAQSVAGDLAD